MSRPKKSRVTEYDHRKIKDCLEDNGPLHVVGIKSSMFSKEIFYIGHVKEEALNAKAIVEEWNKLFVKPDHKEAANAILRFARHLNELGYVVISVSQRPPIICMDTGT